MENELGFAPITINEIAPLTSRRPFRFAQQPTLEGGQFRRFNPYSYPRRTRVMSTSHPQGFEEYMRRQYRMRSAIFSDQRSRGPLNPPSITGMVHSTQQLRPQSSISDISRTMFQSRNMAEYFFDVMQLVAPVVHNGIDLLEHMRLHGTNGMEHTHVINNLQEMLFMREATMAGVNLSMSTYRMALVRYMCMYPRVAHTTQRIPALANPWEMAYPNMERNHPPPPPFTGVLVHEQQQPVVPAPASNFTNNGFGGTIGEELDLGVGFAPASNFSNNGFGGAPTSNFTNNGFGGTNGEELNLGVVLGPASNFTNNGSGGTTGEELDFGVVPAPASNFINNGSGGITREELDLTLRL
ncbi:hypothetical protein FRX31_007627 [Thalictrum thalictroides]|uniref:Uncharacterized protein n=1 Tax=Thalictrum thalictroides TaxID=46969 RepID=A0A7J6X152_THATH|nr:hypothetical protein FRX31_007627 [Thalictrum thalictroides]